MLFDDSKADVLPPAEAARRLGRAVVPAASRGAAAGATPRGGALSAPGGVPAPTAHPSSIALINSGFCAADRQCNSLSGLRAAGVAAGSAALPYLLFYQLVATRDHAAGPHGHPAPAGQLVPKPLPPPLPEPAQLELAAQATPAADKAVSLTDGLAATPTVASGAAVVRSRPGGGRCTCRAPR